MELVDSGDARGSSFSVPAEALAGGFSLRDMHITTIEPASVRGNHYHRQRRELLVVMATDRWSLHWDTGAGMPTLRRDFQGPGAVLITVPTGMSHAIRNDGTAPLRLIGLTDGPFDMANPDTYPRPLVPSG